MSNPAKLYPGSNYATNAQGKLASTAVQPTDLAAVAASIKRIDTYTGTTDANGLLTVVYPVAFAAIPTLQPEPTTDSSQLWVKVTSTTAGFSMRLVTRQSLTVLTLSVLSFAVTNVAGAPVRVVVVGT